MEFYGDRFANDTYMRQTKGMKFSIRIRNFFVGPNTHKTTLSIPEKAYEALQKLSELSGSSVPEVIAEGLEQYLTGLANAGQIDMPKKR